MKRVGQELGVRYVLEGSVQRSGNRMRVNVQLIDGETGNHLWAERFDKPVADLFDMQDKVVARLANQLGTELVAAEARRAERAPHPNSMDLYFQGMAVANRGFTRKPFASTQLVRARVFARSRQYRSTRRHGICRCNAQYRLDDGGVRVGWGAPVPFGEGHRDYDRDCDRTVVKEREPFEHY